MRFIAEDSMLNINNVYGKDRFSGTAEFLAKSMIKGIVILLLAGTNLQANPGITLNLGDGQTMEMVLIKPGKFLMGSEKAYPPLREVTISKPFYVSKYEVTFEEWDLFMEVNDRQQGMISNIIANEYGDYKKHPAVLMSWHDANKFLENLSAKVGYKAQMLTEAEFKYAMFAGAPTQFPWGETVEGWEEYSISQADGKHSYPVGSRKPNVWGLCDMAGNVNEWVVDWHSTGRYPESMTRIDPIGVPRELIVDVWRDKVRQRKVAAGGGWEDNPGAFNRVYHFKNSPEGGHARIGLRVKIPAIESEGGGFSPQPAENLSLDLGKGVVLEVVLIRPGTFTMGADTGGRPDTHPARQVQITKPFYIGKYEVTQDQYMAVMGENPSQFLGGNRPADSVSWHAATAFCKVLSDRLGRNVRLPTEAERQYAYRAETQTRYYWGDDPNNVLSGDYGWSRNNSDKQSHDVGLKKPNAWGLYDMAGNVCEWVSDFYDANGYGGLSCVDPQGRPSGEKHVLCGGSLEDLPGAHYHTFRFKLTPENRSNRTGFRIVLDPEAADPVVAGKSKGSTSGPAPQPPRGNLSLDLGNGVTLDVVLIHPGTFTMGTDDLGMLADARPARQVQITRPFYLGKYEVTQAQYMAVTGEKPSQFLGRNRPVDSVPWYAAIVFCKKLSDKLGRNVRLPTEAEWQHAYGAGIKTRHYWGDDLDYSFVDDYAWNRGNSDQQTHAVGLKKPNAWGLYDMAGNVCEWVFDHHSEKGYEGLSCVDPKGCATGAERVLRGGSWIDHPGVQNCHFRFKLNPSGRSNSTGFRIALDAN